MKIAYDAKRAFYNFTGLGNFARTLLSDMAKYHPEHKYFLFSPKVHKGPVVNEFLDQMMGHPVVSPMHPFHRTWRRYGLFSSANKRKVDIFHGLSHELPYGNKKNIKTVVTMHDIIYKLYPDYYGNIDRKIYHQKNTHACRTADHIIAVSHSTKKDIVSYYGVDEDKVTVIYQSCAPAFRDFFEYRDKQYDVRNKYSLPNKYLLYVGSVIERKKLLETVEAVAKQYSETHIPLVVIGKGKKYMQRVWSYVVENNLEECILFRSNITNADLPYVYHDAEVLIYPSEYEGFGIPVLESLYCATPVISSSTSSLPEVGGALSHYVDEITAEQIALKIKKVLNSPLDKEQRRASFAAHLEQFDPKRICMNHQALYAKLLS